MKTISIKDIKNQAYMADYVDNEVMAGNSLSDIMAGHEGVRVNFCLVVFCFEGQLQVNVNNKTVTLRKDDMLTCVPSTIIGEALLGNTHKVKVFGFSTKFLEVLTAGEQNIDNIIQFMKSNPVRHLSSTQLDPSVLSMYGEIIMRKATERTKRFKEKIMKEIFAAFFCELMAETTEHIDETEVEDNEATRAHIVYKNFMKALAGDDGTHRSVNYYADKLCYSSKYLSYVVRSISGRTATTWINEHTIEIIKHHLRFSEKSVKEIADMLGFPNISFFGKYVKRHTGMSPVAYRNLPND